MKKKYIIGGLILILLFVLFNRIQFGWISVELKSGIRREQADEFFEKYGLSADLSEYSNMFNVKMTYKAVDGRSVKSVTEDSERLSQEIVDRDREEHGENFIILWAQGRGADVISIQFNNRATVDQAKDYLKQFPELEINSLTYSPNWLYVRVPYGSELYWIWRLRRNASVAEVGPIVGFSIFDKVQSELIGKQRESVPVLFQ